MTGSFPKNGGAYLIVGSDGVIGRALTDRLLREGKHVLETTRRSNTIAGRRFFLDIAQDVSEWNVPAPLDTALLCAAVTSLERCRTAPEESEFVNVHQTLELARRLAKCGAFLVFVSTNLVYDGLAPNRRPEEPVCPRTEYGRQKAEAERQLFTLGDRAAVVRFTKVLSSRMPLINLWVRSLRQGRTVHPFSDMVMAPVSVSFAAEVLQKAADARLPGVLQVSASEDVTYAQVARHIARRLNVSPNLVRPVRSCDTDATFEAAPKHTTLDSSRLKSAFGLVPPDLWTTIDTVFGLP